MHKDIEAKLNDFIGELSYAFDKDVEIPYWHERIKSFISEHFISKQELEEVIERIKLPKPKARDEISLVNWLWFNKALDDLKDKLQ